MAGENLEPKNGNNNKRTYVVGDDPRVVHLEGRVERVEGDVRDIKAGVQKLLDRPQNPGFSQVLAGVLTTLLITGIIFGFGEWRLGQAVLPVKEEIASTTKAANQIAASLHAAELRAATMEERMMWVRELARGRTP
jgi:hypothetical protein